jgi:hypothetical protein
VAGGSSASPSVAEAGSSAPTNAAARPAAEPRTRLQKGIRQPKTRTDGTIRWALLTSTGEPENLKEALADTKWKHAMQEEYDALMTNHTWHLVPPGFNKNIIDCKWVYRIKKKC